MKIDLSKIFAKQKILDKHIHQQHNVNYKQIFINLKLALCVELAEFANEIKCFKFWSSKGSNSKEKIIEEYVDVIHFITSICIAKKIKPIFKIKLNNKSLSKVQMTRQLFQLFKQIKQFETKKDIINWYKKFLIFGFKFGFNFEDISCAYDKKNKINHKRQQENY